MEEKRGNGTNAIHLGTIPDCQSYFAFKVLQIVISVVIHHRFNS